MTTTPPILTNLAPLEDFLKSAHRYGVPLPFSVSATDYEAVLHVRAHDIDAWAEYVEAPIVDSDRIDGGYARDIKTTEHESGVSLRVSCWVDESAQVPA